VSPQTADGQDKMITTGILLNLIIGIGTMVGLWFIYLKKRNAALVDLGWAIGLTIMGLTHNLIRGTLSAGGLLTGILVLLWGIRLGGHLFWTRLRLGIKDARYESLHTKSSIPVPLFFLIHYLIQACFQSVVGFVFIFTSSSSTIQSIWVQIGLFLWCIGYAGSIIADSQLYQFRSNSDNRTKVCQTGLWNYSRHPNYFFEILLWFGFSLIGLRTSLGWLGLVSPIILLLTMKMITGPISERHSLKSKPQVYAQYQKNTSMIIPWFKKHRHAPAISDS
jgi:steroid 5-alpha reductase family enzyme